MAPWVMAITAVLAGVLAALLTPLLRAEVAGESRWVSSRLHVLLAVAGGVGAGLAARHPAELAAFAAAAVVVALMMTVDLADHRLPDRFVVAALIALVVPLAVAAATTSAWSSFGRALLGGLALLVGYFLLAYIAPWGLGLGDVKFAAVIGCFLGWFAWQAVAWGTLLAFAINALVGIIVLVSRRGHGRTDIPFGPAMVLGAVLAVGLV